MEVLRLTGYSEEQKGEIARRYLLPRQPVAVGPDRGAVDDSAGGTAPRDLRALHAREAVLRELERTLGRMHGAR